MQNVMEIVKIALIVLLSFGFGWMSGSYRIYNGLYTAMTNNVLITEKRK